MLTKTSLFGPIVTLLVASLCVACGNLETSCSLGRCQAGSAPSVPPPRHARRHRGVLASLDGMGATFLRQQLDRGALPNFAALIRAGATTLNARADHEYTVTLPNHTSMLTGRPVTADPDLPLTTYHGWTTNGTVDAMTTLHNGGNPNLTYVASVFDVMHDHGLSTCMYAGKMKFGVFSNSYNSRNGAPDRVGNDDGRNKMDRVVIVEENSEALIAALEADLAGEACDFTFLHIADLDVEGHALQWGSSGWLEVLTRVDGWLGRVAAFADPNRVEAPCFLVVTADHGGDGSGHSDQTVVANYTIPFFIVGPGIPVDTDLYRLSGRTDPGIERVRYSNPDQPVRNADAANVMTHLLGLPPVPGSFMRDLLK